jgi:uncharacterized cofD-like protein
VAFSGSGAPGAVFPASGSSMNSKSTLRIVSIGGGTGLSALLHGLKRYPADITAVVTVSDDGGSSGRLRREFDVLPPGDIRNCMVALSEDEALLSRLFQYRFQTGRGLKGHSFGNLFVTALTEVIGNFSEAVKASSEVLKIAGRIYPSTERHVTLEAMLEDGTIVRGETRISHSRRRIEEIRLHPENCRPHPDTLAAIAEADLITLGPGSLFTSVIPNLLVEGISDAIRKARAVKAYFVNLMWQPGETSHFTASDHIKAIEKHAGGKLLNYAIVNTEPIPVSLRKRYASQLALPVENDIERIEEMGIKVVGGNFLQHLQKVRHNPEEIAAVAMRLARTSRSRRRTG